MLGRGRDVPPDPVVLVYTGGTTSLRLGVLYDTALHTRPYNRDLDSGAQGGVCRLVVGPFGITDPVAWMRSPLWTRTGVFGDGTCTVRTSYERIVPSGATLTYDGHCHVYE